MLSKALKVGEASRALEAPPVRMLFCPAEDESSAAAWGEHSKEEEVKPIFSCGLAIAYLSTIEASEMPSSSRMHDSSADCVPLKDDAGEVETGKKLDKADGMFRKLRNFVSFFALSFFCCSCCSCMSGPSGLATREGEMGASKESGSLSLSKLRGGTFSHGMTENFSIVP